MKRLYLHIGLMKTGTTALQEFFFLNQAVLAKTNYAYPLLHIGPDHTYDLRNAHFLIYDSPAKDTAEKKAEERRILEQGMEMLAQAFAEADNVILSDEMLWYAQNWLRFPSRLETIRERFGCEIRVIVYLRRQDQFVESYWNQKVKGASRYTMSFPEFLESSHCAGILPDYDAQLTRMCGLYGKENIIVRVYEPGQFDGGTIFSDFLQHTGLSLTDEYQLPETPANLQLSDNFIEIKRQINELADYKDTDNFFRTALLGASEAVAAITGSQPVKSTFFPDCGQAAYVEQFRAGNEHIAREYLGREDGVLFRADFKPLPEWQFNDPTFCRDVMLTMAEADIYQQQKIQSANARIRKLKNDNLELKKDLENLRREVDQMKEEITSMYRSPIFRAYRKVRGMLK